MNILHLVVAMMALGQAPQSAPPLAWTEVVPPSVFAHYRQLASLPDRESEVLDSALQARGYVGDRSFLQGCDLTDLKADRERAILDVVRSVSSHKAFERVRAAVVSDGFPAKPTLPSATLPDEAAQRRSWDQAARRRINEPVRADEDVVNAVLGERMTATCEMDLDNGQWLQTPALTAALLATADAQFLGCLCPGSACRPFAPGAGPYRPDPSPASCQGRDRAP